MQVIDQHEKVQTKLSMHTGLSPKRVLEKTIAAAAETGALFYDAVLTNLYDLLIRPVRQQLATG